MSLKVLQLQPHPSIDSPSKIIKADDVWLRLDAKTALEQAKQQAAEIIAKAEDCYQQRYEQGYHDGQEQAHQQAIENAVNASEQMHHQLKALEQTFVALTIDVIRQMIDEIPPKERVLGLVRQALKLVHERHGLILRVHPDNEQLINDNLSSLHQNISHLSELTVVIDKNLSLEQCIIEHPHGVVEANIQNQLHALKNAFQQALKEQ